MIKPNGQKKDPMQIKLNKQIAIPVAAVVGLIVLLAIIKFVQIQIAMRSHPSGMPPEAVTSIVVGETDWQKTINAVGSLESPTGAMLSTDAPGRIQSINFESGTQVAAGTVLVELDSQVEKSTLAAAQASRDEAARSFERAKTLRSSNTIPQAEFDDARAKAQSTEANVQSLDAMVKRRAIIAPYNGMLGIRQITVGQYVESGTKVVALQSLDPLYVNFALPQSDVPNIRIGQALVVTLEAFPGETFPGKITAIDSQIDSATRTIGVQGTIVNPKMQLRPGMFTRVSVSVDRIDKVIAIPMSSISYAPYGDAVYVIENMKTPDGADFRGVRQQIVKLGEHRGDQVVIAAGLKAGDEIVTSGTFKLRPNAAVIVNNQIQPGNSTNPQPEDQ